MDKAYTIGASAQGIRVAFSRAVASVPEARALQRDIADAVATHGVRRVLFDYTGVGAHTDDVRDCMWQWARDAGLEAIAVIVDNELTRVRLNMTALAQRIPMRAFLGQADATPWLVDPNQRRRTRDTKLM